jgi:hypothetical protein
VSSESGAARTGVGNVGEECRRPQINRRRSHPPVLWPKLPVDDWIVDLRVDGIDDPYRPAPNNTTHSIVRTRRNGGLHIQAFDVVDHGKDMIVTHDLVIE